MISVDQFGWCQLGNQLFQWAMLRAMSARRGYEFRLPVNLELPKTKGRTELGCFRLQYAALRPEDSVRLRHKYSETTKGFDPNVFDQPDETLFTGFFQTEKYFADIAPQIRAEARFLPKIEATAERYIGFLRGQYPGRSIVAMHVRRGDYLKRWARKKLRVMRAKYFFAATEMLPPGDNLFLVFSDDMRWCRRKIRHRRWAIEYCQTDSHVLDLAIMSRCDHFIISPSSFSWWGAWLAANPRKVVVAPKPWFGPKMEPDFADSPDIAPPSWLRLAA